MNALLAIVEQEPATLKSGPVRTPESSGSNVRRWVNGLLPKRSGEPSARPDGSVEVSGRDARSAQQEATRLFGRFEVLDGYQTYSLVGQKRVVLVVRPLADVPGGGGNAVSLTPFTSAEVLWNRSTLRSLGVPPSVMKRLPLDDPYTQEDWEAMLLAILSREVDASNLYAEAGTVNGVGARGAAAILAGIEAGIPPGTLELGGIKVPATGDSLLAALRSGMPRRFPEPPATPPPGFRVRDAELTSVELELPAPPQASLGEVEQVYGEFEEASAETEAASAFIEDSAAIAESVDVTADADVDMGKGTNMDVEMGALLREDAAAVAVDAAEGVIASGALAELMGAASETRAARAAEETGAIPVVRAETAAAPKAVLVSGEVTGKRPRAARPRSVPGSDKTPYPAPQED